jgi:hypothetical protein
MAVASLLLHGEASAQSMFDEMVVDGETVSVDTLTVPAAQAPRTPSAAQQRQRRAQYVTTHRPKTEPSLWDLTDADGNPLDPSKFGAQELEADSTLKVDDLALSELAFMPLIFRDYSMKLPETLDNPLDIDATPPSELNWVERVLYRDRRSQVFQQQFMIDHPELVRYNINNMPRPPKEFRMDVDPQQAKITVTEFTRNEKEMKGVASTADIGRINWLQNFEGSMQFSQAYLSPNWYQGGNSNLNSILNLLYNVKLNQKFHPNLMFETSIQYKLGMNNAPDDTVHAYNISEDLLQVNTKFGVKAAKRWYYSVNAQFKTQVLNNYRKNSDVLSTSFLSPGELTVGVGMTYNYTTPNNKFTFAAVLAPLSYNMKMCTSTRLNPTSFGIEEGHKTISQYGSNSELTWTWKMAYNVTYTSRLFLFTNYEYVQGDWENTITFTINRFLSSKIYGNLRYQSDAEPMEGTKWHKLQFKEILSIGFSYTFQRS